MDKKKLLESIQGNRWARRVLWAAGGLILIWAMAWLAVPPLLKSQAEKLGSQALGRQVRIGAVDFRPWSLELAVSELRVASADGQSVQLGVQRLYADLELQSLLRLAPVVDALTVDGPVLRLAHLGEGRYDIDDVLHKLSQPSDAPAGDPLRFALYNLALRGGAVDFSDATVNRTHALRELSLSVPFLSNLASRREVKVLPHLAFTLNGSRFDSAAESTPFAQTRKTDATLRIAGLDLAPYLGYLPASLPVRLTSALLDADLKLSFAQTPEPAVRLSGSLQARGVQLTDTRQQALLGFEMLSLGLEELRPLERAVRLSAVELQSPGLSLRRDRAGQLNLAPPPATPAAAAGAAPPPSAWQLAVARVAVRDGRIGWIDDTTAAAGGAPARIALRGFTLDASDIAVPFARPAQFQGAVSLAGADSATPPAAEAATGSLQFSGSASDRSAKLKLSAKDLPLSLAQSYVAQFLGPKLSGTLHAAADLEWQAASEPGRAAALKLNLERLSLEQLALAQGRNTLASIAALELAQARIDLGARSVALGRLALTEPRVKAGRGADGRWMFETWMRSGQGGGAPGAGGAAGPAWKLSVEDLRLDGGQLGWQDLATPRPVAFEVSALALQAQGLDLAGRRPAPLQLSARVKAGRTEPGRLAFRGQLGPNPLAAQGRVDLVHLPLHALEPYFGDALNIELLRADASFKGQLRYADSPAGPQLRVTGDGALEELRAHSVPGSPASGGAVRAGASGAAVAPSAPSAAREAAGLRLGEELLAWKALNLRGIELALAPGQPTRVEVKETALSDFFARVIIQESGRINLQDLVKSSAASGAPAAAPAGAGSAPVPAPGPAPVMRFGPVSLLGGKVLFSDRFIQPNYSADLSELTGKLSAFSSVAPQGGTPELADLELRGRAEGTASLQILGKINPLAQPLALDIQGKVRDLELPPLSPYSVKFAGHGIERGKLSLEVTYTVQPNGQLTATNQLVLNQLSFGDKVENAPASLPVKLAVALLADRNGVIDINLPISGSLNDPQFSLGPVIFKAIVNLIAKALTSPFSLLAGALGGGGDELGSVAFAPGSALLGAEARQNLDKLAKAMTERPALRMTVVGTASLQAEREGYQRERLRALVLAEKRRALLAGGAAADAVTLGDAEYPALLKEVYRRADMPKPRNLIGLAKDLPPAEMEALLLAHVPVNEDLMRELALQRGVAVRDYLVARSLPVERLFLGAAKTVAAEPAWRPQAELSLSMR